MTKPAEFTIVGQLVNASNSTIVLERDGERFVYKPVTGERPLWDFPDGTLAFRERAAFVLSNLLGWDLVPETVIIDGPYGIGSLQNWIPGEVSVVDIFARDEIPTDWLVIASGLDEDGKPVTLAHAQDERLMKLALFDAVINNADRKAGHVITTPENFHFGIDHGVTFHAEPKLRTVLWGWIGNDIPQDWLANLEAAIEKIPESELPQLISKPEVDALTQRMRNLIASGKFPSPSPNWPAVPWPVF